MVNKKKSCDDQIMELVIFEESKNQIVVSSKDISINFVKRHDNVLRDIDNFKDLPNFEEMFYETKMDDSYGRKQRTYLMNRDGFSLLVMGFTGKDALEWKVKYIQAFNEMEQKLNSPEFIVKKAMTYLQDRCNRLEMEAKENLPKVTFATGFGKTKSLEILNKLVDNGHLQKIGNGLGTKYTLI